MPVLQVQDEFQSGDNVTASSLNDLVNDASFVSGAVDNSTLQVASAGHLKVKDNGILSNHLKSDATNDSVRAVTTNHIRNDAVTNDKIADLAVGTDQIASDAVTYTKIQNVSETDRVLGRKSTGAGDIEEISPSDLLAMINVEAGATADQTDAEIKTAYENNDDTNAFTNAEKIKLSGIEANATADQTASEIKTAYESNDDTNAFTDAEKNKLSEIETGATADQSASEIKTAYESNTDTNAFTDTEKIKLSGIAAGAEVNVQSDWTATEGDALILNKPTITSGTVTSVATGTGLEGGTITDAGTISISSTDTTFKITSSEIVVNAGGADKDFRVGGVTQNNLFVVNAERDAVAVGGTYPNGANKVLYVNGSHANGSIGCTGNIQINTNDNAGIRISTLNNTNPLQHADIFHDNLGTITFTRPQKATSATTHLFAEDGDTTSLSGVYGTISDRNLKENINYLTEDQKNGQVEDIKNLRFAKFNLIGEDRKQLGVIAQDVEETSPGLVSKAIRNGVEVRSVKQSIIHQKAVVALQVALEKIEDLEQRLKLLES